jgi:hypothetical protein
MLCYYTKFSLLSEMTLDAMESKAGQRRVPDGVKCHAPDVKKIPYPKNAIRKRLKNRTRRR